MTWKCLLKMNSPGLRKLWCSQAGEKPLDGGFEKASHMCRQGVQMTATEKVFKLLMRTLLLLTAPVRLHPNVGIASFRQHVRL